MKVSLPWIVVAWLTWILKRNINTKQSTNMARLNFLGFVISQGKMEKTIKVRILQKKFDRKVQKYFLQKKDYLVHDEGNICREGDLVRIEQTRPLSARKFFAVAEIKKNKGQQFATYQKEAKANVQKEEREKSSLLEQKRTLYEKFSDNSLYEDLSSVQDLRRKENLTEEEVEKITEIMGKYNISNTNVESPSKELFTTSISSLSSKIESLSNDLKLTETLNNLLNDETKKDIVYQISEKLNITPETKKNIRKNLIRKYLKTAPSEELQKLGLSL